VWDAWTGTALLDLKGLTSPITGFSFSPDGTRIVGVCSDETATVLDALTGTALFKLKGQLGGRDVWFSPDGTRIVIGDGERGGYRTAKIWDSRTGDAVNGEPIPPAPRPGQISPDGRRIARVGFNRVELVPIQAEPEELEYRRIHTQPNPWRYREGYDEAKKAGDQFATKFYLDLLTRPEREQRQALAVAEREIREGRTEAAIRHLIIASALDPGDTSLAIRLAALQAWFGQDKELAETGARALDFAKGTYDPWMIRDMARICCLRPTQDKLRLEASLALARKAAELGQNILSHYPTNRTSTKCLDTASSNRPSESPSTAAVISSRPTPHSTTRPMPPADSSRRTAHLPFTAR
jgi:hypothetical protein